MLSTGLLLVWLVIYEFHLGDLRPNLFGWRRSGGNGFGDRLFAGSPAGWFRQYIAAEMPDAGVADLNAVSLTNDGNDGVIGSAVAPQLADELGMWPQLRVAPGTFRAEPRDQLLDWFIWKIHWKIVSKQFRKAVSVSPSIHEGVRRPLSYMIYQ
jgi:hypothetical protein